MIELTISNILYAKLFLLFFETSYLTFAVGPWWLLSDTSVVSADLQLVVSNCSVSRRRLLLVRGQLQLGVPARGLLHPARGAAGAGPGLVVLPLQVH